MKRNLPGTPLYPRLHLGRAPVYFPIVSTLDTGGASEDVVKRFMDSFTLASTKSDAVTRVRSGADLW